MHSRDVPKDGSGTNPVGIVNDLLCTDEVTNIDAVEHTGIF